MLIAFYMATDSPFIPAAVFTLTIMGGVSATRNSSLFKYIHTARTSKDTYTVITLTY